MTKDEAIAWAGGTQALLAERLGMRQASVSLWDRVPPLRQLQIEALSGGEVRADADCDKFRVPSKEPT
jgi:DNA-binding transcriptional regulator YdaS (Cro superfamily)